MCGDRPGASAAASNDRQEIVRGAVTVGLTGTACPLYSAGFVTSAFRAGRLRAPVAELVDALDSKSSSARSAGSIPARGTILHGFPKQAWHRFLI